MKVSELIAVLAKLPQDLEVKAWPDPYVDVTQPVVVEVVHKPEGDFVAVYAVEESN